mmetsp:Transcript_33307/g.48893  ORF Transcript_33307/g.48893 Transcript_33307/m.48893 type:complete len:82 (-) Transcript_33307:191-436(-)
MTYIILESRAIVFCTKSSRGWPKRKMQYIDKYITLVDTLTSSKNAATNTPDLSCLCIRFERPSQQMLLGLFLLGCVIHVVA